MENIAKYSVLMSVYVKEKPEYLMLALDSMLNQTVKPDEIVLVEDGPLTDELYAVLDEYAQKDVPLCRVRNEKNLGLGLALNVGLQACRNELVARMDTDDISKPDRCQKQLQYIIQNPEVSIVGGQIEEFIDSTDNVVGKRLVPTTDTELQKYLQKRCPFNHMTVMFKKSEVEAVGNYQDWFWNEDYYLWIRMALAKQVFGNLEDVLVSVRVGKEMYSRRGGQKYFKSELALQKYMLSYKLISLPRYIVNVTLRLVIQRLMPNWLRGIVFRMFARK